MNEKIEICNYVSGGCTECPFYDKCTVSFQTIREKKEWINIINDMIYNLENVKKAIDNTTTM